VTAAVTRRGFDLGLPDGFIELPVDPDQAGESLVAKVAALFGLPPDSDYAKAATAALSAIGTTAGAGGLDYSAVTFYRSPDDPDRPIMVVLGATTMPSEHHRPQTAVDGLLEIRARQDRGTPTEYRLPIGPAVVLVSEEEHALRRGADEVPILSRALSLYVPDPDGTTVGVVTVQTNCWQDWDRVCVLALEIFDSFEWHPLDAHGPH
jgi:hypothetical protein